MPMCSDPAWHRVRLRWRNVRCQSGPVQHPHHVIHALLVPTVKAAHPKGGLGKAVWCWHPAGAWPAKTQKDAQYELVALFPATAEQPAARFHEALARNHERRHFILDDLHPPEPRDLATLEAEAQGLDWSADELCLDFLTPLFWELQVKQRLPLAERWRLDRRRLCHLLHHRLAHFFGFAVPPPEAPLPEVEVRSFHARPIGGGHAHASKSGSGARLLSGLLGPVYLRGEWQALRLHLLLCSEIQLGGNTTIGQGHFQLATQRQHFDPRLAAPQTWQRARRDFDLHLGEKGREPEGALPDETALATLAASALDGTLAFTPARRVRIPKEAKSPPTVPEIFAPDTRDIAMLTPPEQFVHFVLHRVIAQDFERLFLPCSIGSRPRHSRESAAPFIAEALRRGFTHVVEADVAHCFDELDWELLGELLRRHLPRADRATVALLERCIRHPLADPDGTPLVRRRGILQGSPLSSLLANLYLHEWDSAMLATGRPFVRYVDDVCLFARSEEDAAHALAEASSLLAVLDLEFHPKKTGTIEAAAGFRYLGLTYGGEQPAGTGATAPFHRRLFLTRPHTWAGVDGGALALRQGDSLEHRVPLRRVGELILLGAGGISIPLIERCLDRKIPVTFCSQAGSYHGTIHADRRETYARIARHHQRYREAGPAACAALAAAIVRAKLANYLHWLAERPARDSASLRRTLAQRHDAIDRHLATLEPEHALAAIRGEEGAAAAASFPWVHSRVPGPEWACARRLPHDRPDRWNLLLDTLSFLLFSHLNTLLRTRGLDPYLGFLHSPQNRYESLVCDLMEPFRARLDRFALWLVREGVIVPAMCAPGADGRWGFNHDGWKAILEHFERQLDFAYAADHGRPLRALLEHQVHALQSWVDAGTPLHFHTHPVSAWKKPRRPQGNA